MRVGVAIVDSTPPVGTYLGGYARWRASCGVRDRLRASAVAFESAESGALIVALDAVFVHETVADDIRRGITAAVGVDGERVLVNCSHSHSTPYGVPGTWGAAHHRRYRPVLIERAVRAGIEAWAARREATLTLRRGTSTINVNRRMPKADGLVDFGWNEVGSQDPEFQRIQVDAVGGGRICDLLGFPCHPIVFPPGSLLISADLVGEARSRVEASTGAPCVYLQGACADINPRHEWGGNDDRDCVALGSKLACDVLDVGAHISEDRIEDGAIVGRDEELWLALEPERDARTNDVVRYWRGVVRDVPMPKLFADALLWRMFPWETRVARGDDGVARVPLRVQGLRIGGLLLAAHGSETFHETALAVRAAFPDTAVMFAGYSNGMIGYVPTPEAIPLRGYEVDVTPYLYRLPGRFSPTAEPTARRRTVEILSALRAM